VFAAADDRSIKGITGRAPHLDAGRLSDMLEPWAAGRWSLAARKGTGDWVRIDLNAG